MTEFGESQATVVGPETTGEAVRINFLDPTVAFGEDYTPGVIASIDLERGLGGELAEETRDGVNSAIGFSIAINALDHARSGMPRSIGHDTDPLNPLTPTAREAALIEKWKSEDTGNHEEAEDQDSRGVRIAVAAGSTLTD